MSNNDTDPDNVPPSIGDVVSRYQRLDTISAAIDRVSDHNTNTPDGPTDDSDQVRRDYMSYTWYLLKDIAEAGAAVDPERRQALHSLRDMAPSTHEVQALRTHDLQQLNQEFDQARAELDRDIAAAVDKDLLLDILADRDNWATGVVNDLNDQYDQVTDLTKQLGDRDRRISDLERDNAALAMQIRDNREWHDAALRAAGIAEAELDRIRAKQGQQIADLDTRVGRLTAEHATLAEQVTELKTELAAPDRRIADLHQKLEPLGQDNVAAAGRTQPHADQLDVEHPELERSEITDGPDMVFDGFER